MLFPTSNWLMWVCLSQFISSDKFLWPLYNFYNLQELKGEKAYGQLRAARNDARIVGIRLKQKNAEKDEKKPADE